jgi:uncharacterized protein YndB with AHSA1/START domain
MEKEFITLETKIHAPVDQVWKCWTTPDHIVKWNHASDDWHTPHAENDLRVGGTFSYRMEAKDGSFGFDFAGVYDRVVPHELIEYTMEDGRKVTVSFSAGDIKTKVVETFEAETENPVDMQRAGWQAVLENFKKYIESNT